MDRDRAISIIKTACVRAAVRNAVSGMRKSAQAAAPAAATPATTPATTPAAPAAAPSAAPTTGKYKGLSASQVEEKLNRVFGSYSRDKYVKLRAFQDKYGDSSQYSARVRKYLDDYRARFGAESVAQATSTAPTNASAMRRFKADAARAAASGKSHADMYDYSFRGPNTMNAAENARAVGGVGGAAARAGGNYITSQRVTGARTLPGVFGPDGRPVTVDGGTVVQTRARIPGLAQPASRRVYSGGQRSVVGVGPGTNPLRTAPFGIPGNGYWYGRPYYSGYRGSRGISL